MSTLPFLSKLIERMAVSQISEYLEREGLNEPLQSAYRPFHSTETTLVRVQSDLLMALDSVGGAAVILLDQSAAFDLIDHDIFSETLTSEFGLVGTAHKWIMSYLHNRFQQVKVHGVCSSKRPLRYGTPQGSVIGHLLFSLYTKPLGRLLRSLEINFHFYADDCQLYITFDPKADDGLMLARKKTEETVSTVHNWMTTHYLKMNPDKIFGRCTVATSLHVIFVLCFDVCLSSFVQFLEYLYVSTCKLKLCSVCGCTFWYYFCHFCLEKVMFLRHLNCLPQFTIPANSCTTSPRHRHAGRYRPACPNGHRPGTMNGCPARGGGVNAGEFGIGCKEEETDPHYQ